MKKNYIAPKTVSVEVDCMELIAQSEGGTPIPDGLPTNVVTQDDGLVKGQSLNYSVWDEEW